MRRLLLIGIGVGDPEFVTVAAINALNQVDVFFALDKGPELSDLARARQQLCDRYIRNREYRTVTIADVRRDRSAAEYATSVDNWRDERATRLERAITTELTDEQCGGFLVWGDPSLYDGTIHVINTIIERGTVALDYQVIPGISSIQALAGRHRITLNRVARPVHITTGRRLAEGLPNSAEDIVVMLDAHLSCAAITEPDIDIYWGAYLGTEKEILIAGKLHDVIDHIARIRRELRLRHGWIMDTYLLRRNRRTGS